MHDEQNYRFIAKDKVIDLTVAENKLLRLLILNKNNIVTYEKICTEIYKQELDCCFKTNIYVMMSRLRTKLKDEVKIITKTGIGCYIR